MNNPKPLIINACLTGIVPQKRDNPNVPISPDEIIQDARKVIDLGVSMIHIHARHPDGKPAFEKELYSQIIQGIRDINPDVIVCATTSGRTFKNFDQRTNALELQGINKPDFGSLILGSMNFPGEGVLNDPETIINIAQKMQNNGIHPEWEVFEPGMLHYGKYLVKSGILEPPKWINILLGSLGTSPATARVLSLFISMIPDGSNWAATGVGRFQYEVNEMAVKLGGHVRVGLEDSFYMDTEKKIPATNEMLVSRIVYLAKKYGRDIATPKQARRMIL